MLARSLRYIALNESKDTQKGRVKKNKKSKVLNLFTLLPIILKK